jgi:urease accessory protein
MRKTLALILAVAYPGVALAHHFMGGATPQTFAQGLLSGLGHPIIGADHAAFIVGAGFLLGLAKDGLWGVLALVLGTLVGAMLHLAGWTFTLNEVAVALSVVLVGALLVFQAGGRWVWALVALAGALHGYAYAESIFGAEPAPLYAYLVGFCLIQFAVAAAAFLLQRRLPKVNALSPALGLVVGVVGAAFFFSNLI